MPLAPSYSVLSFDSRFRAIIAGHGFQPTIDGSALMGAWHREGYRYVSGQLGASLGALVAVVKDPALVESIITEIEGGEYDPCDPTRSF